MPFIPSDARATRRAALVAAAALVLAVAACDLDPDQAPPTSLEGSGMVTGQVYFDANGNGTFDPLGGDTVLVGAAVDLSARGDSARVLKSTTTSAGGAFSFTGVPIGTHEVRARVAGNQIVTCVAVPVTVQVSAQAFASTPLRISCRIDVAVAERRNQGNVITVGGIVTAAPGVYRPANGYIQDATGGIQIFSIPGGTASGIQEGDSIEVTGPLGNFSQELEVTPVTSFRIVTRGNYVDTMTYTIKAIRDSFAANSQVAKPVGELVRVRGVRIRGVPAAPTAPAGTDFRIVQGTDSIGGRFDQAQSVQASIDPVRDETKCYDVVGTLGQFGSTLQLKPRRPSDITVVACPAN